jgi:hypothetical protein
MYYCTGIIASTCLHVNRLKTFVLKFLYIFLFYEAGM